MLKDHYYFCPSCGTAIEPVNDNEGDIYEDSAEPGESIQPNDENSPPTVFVSEQKNTEPEIEGPVTDGLDGWGSQSSPSVDRKTLFSEGMLVLTDEAVILYSHDEQDEIKRIPINMIGACSRGLMKRSLVIDTLTNIDENFDKYVAEQQLRLAEIEEKIQTTKRPSGRNTNNLLMGAILSGSGKRRNASTKAAANAILSEAHIQRLHQNFKDLTNTVSSLHTDTAFIRKVKRQKADIVKVTFRLPKNYSGPHTVSEEYKIWEHAIRRRLNGPQKLRVLTSPPEAIVFVNDVMIGNTPIISEVPLIDDAILEGKYMVRIEMEGHETEKFFVPLNRRFESRQLELAQRAVPYATFDSVIAKHRKDLPDRTIDLEQYVLKMEVHGTDCVLMLTEDQALVLSKDKKRWLLDIPYADISVANMEKKFLRGKIYGITITYRDDSFDNLKYNFEIDAGRVPGGKSALWYRYDAILARLRQGMKESSHRTVRPRMHSPKYYEITEDDIENGFSRFDAYDFEKVVAQLFEDKGYLTIVTQASSDMGADVIARNKNETIVIQVKKWNGTVGGPDVHKTLGSMISQHATKALVVTTSDFTRQAYKIAEGNPVELWNGTRLANEFRDRLHHRQVRDN